MGSQCTYTHIYSADTFGAMGSQCTHTHIDSADTFGAMGSQCTYTHIDSADTFGAMGSQCTVIMTEVPSITLTYKHGNASAALFVKKICLTTEKYFKQKCILFADCLQFNKQHTVFHM